MNTRLGPYCLLGGDCGQRRGGGVSPLGLSAQKLQSQSDCPISGTRDQILRKGGRPQPGCSGARRAPARPHPGSGIALGWLFVLVALESHDGLWELQAALGTQTEPLGSPEQLRAEARHPWPLPGQLVVLSLLSPKAPAVS